LLRRELLALCLKLTLLRIDWGGVKQLRGRRAVVNEWERMNTEHEGERYERHTLGVLALAWQARQPGWLKDDGQYIPLPATWLNGARWEDEPPMKIQRVMSDAASLVFQTLNMGKP